MGVGEKKRTLKLHCPSMAKIVQLVAWEEERLDLGSISRAFGFDPATLKINGHFIGRGVDFIASSVTWKSLLSFFSARGLSTGTSDSDSLTINGKLSKLGSKRGHDPAGPLNAVPNQKQVGGGLSSSLKELQLEDINFTSNKRLKESNHVIHVINGTDSTIAFNCSTTKRKSLFGDAFPLKRERRNSDMLGLRERNTDLTKSNLNNKYSCHVNENIKRAREEDLVAALHKRIKL